VIPLAPGIARAIDLALGERCDGPIFLTPAGERLDRHGAGRIVRRVTRGAGLAKKIYPHRLRHAFITVALDAGVPLRDVQEAASHADPRSTRSRPRLALPARYLHRRRLHCRSSEPFDADRCRRTDRRRARHPSGVTPASLSVPLASCVGHPENALDLAALKRRPAASPRRPVHPRLTPGRRLWWC
jgi:hypothetical protein